MRILAINCGSSSLKFQVIEAGREEKAGDRELPIANGTVDRIRRAGAIEFTTEEGDHLNERLPHCFSRWGNVGLILQGKGFVGDSRFPYRHGQTFKAWSPAIKANLSGNSGVSP